ncbi:hypothetical protein NDU88_005333 [Pleurodeles waltl]|uniref:Uncharacterized protein n=1 Tax=Pleurodeles waltl TaxID=8319 RepID=A0AAV7RKP5_PLEWA|nr:hypothetical protein NDU88_005333 [Pleurodeles waltl]
MESRFSNPCDDNDGIRNPSRRIPKTLPGHQDNRDAIDVTGNPDIQVPEGIKSDDGLLAGRALEGEDAGGDARKDGRRNRKGEQRPLTEKPKTSSVMDTTTNKEVPEGRELRHVPGGTLLNQLQGRYKRAQLQATFVALQCGRSHSVSRVMEKKHWS